MWFTDKRNSDDRVADVRKKARQSLKAKERERQQKRDQTTKLKALRLEREAAEKKEALGSGTTGAQGLRENVRHEE